MFLAIKMLLTSEFPRGLICKSYLEWIVKKGKFGIRNNKKNNSNSNNNNNNNNSRNNNNNNNTQQQK